MLFSYVTHILPLTDNSIKLLFLYVITSYCKNTIYKNQVHIFQTFIFYNRVRFIISIKGFIWNTIIWNGDMNLCTIILG